MWINNCTLLFPVSHHPTVILVHIFKLIPKPEHTVNFLSSSKLPASDSLIWMHKYLIMCINSKYMQFWRLVLKTWPVNAIGQSNTSAILLPFVFIPALTLFHSLHSGILCWFFWFFCGFFFHLFKLLSLYLVILSGLH